MIKIKAIEIIKTFSKKEKSDFKDFITLGYFNKKKKLIKLYDIILNNLENISANDISEEKLFSALFKKNKFSYSFIRNMMSEMLSLCEKFLIVNKFNHDGFNDYTANRILLTEYISRLLDNNFRSKIKKLREDVKKLKIHTEYYDMLSTIEGKDVTFNLQRSSMENVTLKVLQRSEYNLCSITQLLEFDITDLTVNTFAYNLNFDSELLPEFIKNLDIKNFLKFLKEKRSPLQDELEMRLRLILISTDQDNVENYFILKKLILKRIDYYSNVEKSNLLIKLKNYCSVRVYKGDMKFRDEKFALAKIEAGNIEYNSDEVGPLYAIVYIETIQKALIEKDRELCKPVY